MLIKQIKKFVFLFFVFTYSFFLLGCQGGKQDRARGSQGNIFRDPREEDVRIDFFGKIVDQNENPLPGVEVILRRYHFNQVTPFFSVDSISLKTDSQGRFSLANKTGHKLSISKIEKPGYDEWYKNSDNSKKDEILYLRKKSQTGLEDEIIYCMYGKYISRPDPGNPVVYHLRKLGEMTYIVESGIGRFQIQADVKDSGREYGFDFIKRHLLKSEEIKTSVRGGEPVACDLKIIPRWNPKDHTWSLTLSAGTPGGGILASDQLLYEAPTQGYESSVPLTPGPDSSRIRYLYLRTRTPFIYTRLDLGSGFKINGKLVFVVLTPKDSSEFLMIFQTATNPYGERNFEMAKNLPYEIERKLKEEVKTYIRFNPNGRPPKPDLHKLLQEWCTAHPGEKK